MKKLASILTIVFMLSGLFLTGEVSAKPKKAAGKHKSHKKAKKSKSGYFYNFQH